MSDSDTSRHPLNKRHPLRPKHPLRKKAKPLSRRRDRQRQGQRKAARRRARERGAGCALWTVGALTVPVWLATKRGPGRSAVELDVVGLGGPGEWAREPEGLQLGLAHALYAWGV